MSCTICAGIDPTTSNVVNGRNLGVSEATIRRHLAHRDVDEYFQVPNELITSRGKTVRLADGSYEKVTWQPKAKALWDSRASYDDMERAIESFTPANLPRHSERHASVLNASDLQIGKAAQRWGGTPETITSVMRSFHRFADLLRKDVPSEALLADGGDIIENIWNVAQQRTTNDLDLPAQIRTARRLMLEGIKIIAPLVPKLTVLSVPSNHGGSRVGYKTPEATVDADFGLEINYQLEDVLEGRDGFEHVSFVRPEPLESTALVTLANTKLAYHHGDESGGVLKHGAWWQSIDHGRLPGWDADMLVTAHFHTDAKYRSGDGRLILACASSDPGSDWFSSHSGESARRGMTTFNVLDGELLSDTLI